MLVSFALIIVAIYLCCTLLFRLSVHALPLFAAFAAGLATFQAGYGIILAMVAATLAAIAVIAGAQIALGLVKSRLGNAIVGLAFAIPAALAGYFAVSGIAVATMPPGIWQIAVSLIGACVIGTASWIQWSQAGW